MQALTLKQNEIVNAIYNSGITELSEIKKYISSVFGNMVNQKDINVSLLYFINN